MAIANCLWALLASRRVAEARNLGFRTHRVAVYAGPREGTVAELAYVRRERDRQLAFASRVTSLDRRVFTISPTLAFAGSPR
jgi:hypothetical protein